MEKLKMYILVKNTLPVGKAVVGIAHASLACYLKYKETAEVEKWINGPFYKTICLVTEEEFEQAKYESDNIIITESSLNNQETVLAFKLRYSYPKYFKFYKLYR